MESSCDIYLPEEVVIDILSRLPVKAVLRFKCVCKCWCALIKTASFNSKHFLNYHNNQKPQVYVYNSIYSIGKCGFTLIPDETLVGHHDLDNIEINPNLIDMIGPVNGLFFLHHYHDAVTLWNPATRDFRSIPLPLTNLPPHSAYDTYRFGFGFDPSANEYKVVWIRSMWDEYDDPVDTVIALYTLGNDSWRYLEIVDSVLDSIRLITTRDACADLDEAYYCQASTGAYLNGAYYWLTSTENGSYHTMVLFDMSTHVFKEIKVPNNTEPVLRWWSLVLHDDSIALIRYDHACCDHGHHLDMWVMEEEGCWTQLFSVRSRLPVIQPLGIWNKNEIFGCNVCYELVLYNHNTDETRDVVPVDNFCEYFWVYRYKESLVSLNGGDPDKLSNIPEESSNLVCYRRRDDE